MSIRNVAPSSPASATNGNQSTMPTSARNDASGSSTRQESPLPARGSSSASAPRSSTAARGLVAMGESLKLKTGSAVTHGAGPCLAVGVTYADGDDKRAMLSHLQPEADLSTHAAQVAAFMPDRFSADMHVHVSSAPGTDPAEQKSRAEATVAALAAKYDNIVLDEDNVHQHDSD